MTEKEPGFAEILAIMDKYVGVGPPNSGSGYIFLKKRNGGVIHRSFYIDDRNVVREHITGKPILLTELSEE